MVMLSLYCTLLCIWLTEYIFMKCIIFPHSYFSHVLLLRILYIQLQTVKCINCIINCNIVPYSYFPHVLLLHILYIQLQTVKCINCIINCNIVPYSYFLMFCYYISCIYSYRLWNVLTVLLTVILSHIHISSCSVTTYPVYTATDCEMY